jgi:hypothetical protein
LIDSHGNTVLENFHKTFRYLKASGQCLTNEIIADRIFCGGSSFVFKKDVIDKAYPIPQDIRRGVDYYLTAVSSCYSSVEYIPEILGKYRMHGNNLTLFAGQQRKDELGIVNKDFAYTRRKTLETLNTLDILVKNIDLNIIKRIQAREKIFYEILCGSRTAGFKLIPDLFTGDLSAKDLLKGIVIGIITVILPSSFLPKFVRTYSNFKIRNYLLGLQQ